ncbi:prepilin-type N-terminal cleavage/methylation domain-containing protein [Microbacterium sp. SS28]|uniref:prepilin-type N-terminal cleavage/methylation domain-containing protein n=1 Tax=Microbacterium sp. SS28 TaxID=2919948 RepID=UPI001FA9D96F|nr:prepilin-type N-terminal cleavage/methylation domain-containing protein [Microbacterium sp. SS28]
MQLPGDRSRSRLGETAGREVDKESDAGFGLVELVIAMLLLAVIAVAIAPAIWNGIRYSSDQTTVATATRQLNSLVDQAHDGESCASVAVATGSRTFVDGRGRQFTTAAEDPSGTIVTPACSGTSLVKFTLVARQAGKELARVDAMVYVP